MHLSYPERSSFPDSLYRIVNKKTCKVEIIGTDGPFPKLKKSEYNPDIHRVDPWIGVYALDGQPIFLNDLILTFKNHCGSKRKKLPNKIRVVGLVSYGEYNASFRVDHVAVYKNDKHLEQKGDWRGCPHMRTIDRYNIERSDYWRSLVEHLPYKRQTKAWTDAICVLGNLHEDDPFEIELGSIPDWMKKRFKAEGVT